MAARDPSTQSLIRRLLGRIGNPLEWSEVDKCYAFASLLCGLTVAYCFRISYLLEHPTVEPYFDRKALLLLRTGMGSCALVFAGLSASALWLRSRLKVHRWLTVLTLQSTFVFIAAGLYVVGPFTTAIILAPMALMVFALLFFDATPVIAAIGTFLAIFLGTTVLERLGQIPYAPLFAWPPYEGKRPSDPWHDTQFILSILFGAYFVWLLVFVLSRWRRREEEVKEAKLLLEASNAQLSKATQLIRRYVPSQLAEQIIGTGAAPEATERRVLTVFFSDIRGFTQAAEKLAPERLAALLNEYLSEMAIIAKEFGGTLDKFVGDAVMVFFGAPEPLPEKEQALRCVKMAQAMHKRLREIGARWLSEEFVNPFEVRMGVNTGPVHVGNFGSSDRMDYTVVGHHVNLASRLESACAPGKILLSQATYELVKAEIPCQSRGEISAKGIREPVQVWEVAA